MTTKAQKAKEYRNVRIWAYSVLFGMLTVSLAANALSAMQYGNDPVSIGISALPPLSLFASSSLLERIRETKWYWSAIMALAALASLTFSWVHIAQLAIIHHQHPVIAWILPIVVDVPMILAGKVLIDHRIVENAAIRTTPAIVKVAAKPIKSRQTKAIPATA